MSSLRELARNRRQGRRVPSDGPEAQGRGRRGWWRDVPGADRVSDISQPLEDSTFHSAYRAEPRQTQSLNSRTHGVPGQPAPPKANLLQAGQQPGRDPLIYRPQQQQQQQQQRQQRQHQHQHRLRSGSRGRGYVAHDPFRATTGQDEEAVAEKTTWDDIEAGRPQASSRPASAGSRYGRPAAPLRAPPRRPAATQDLASLVAIEEEDSINESLGRSSFARQSRESLSSPRWNRSPVRQSSVLSDVVFVRRAKMSRRVSSSVSRHQEGEDPQEEPLDRPPVSPQYSPASAFPEASLASSAPLPADGVSSRTNTSRGRRADARPIPTPSLSAVSIDRRVSVSASSSGPNRHRERRREWSRSPSRRRDTRNRPRSRSRSRSRSRESQRSRSSTRCCNRRRPSVSPPRSRSRRSRSPEPERWQTEYVEIKVDPRPKASEAVELSLAKEHTKSQSDHGLWESKDEKYLESLSPSPTAEEPFQDVEAAAVPPKRASTLGWLVEYSTKGIPRDAYNYFLLRLPSLYFSRVARIFEEADLSLGEIKEMALESASKSKAIHVDSFFMDPQSATSPAYESLKHTWEGFIDSVMREWKTFNIISVLLLSAILTILQIDAAAKDAVTRYTALASLICALMSLLYGCMYIIRFGTMRKPYKAAEWALEAKKSGTSIFWNVWVLLAMPAVWLSWSLILYICCIMSFVWRTTTFEADPYPLSTAQLLAIRILITSLLLLGIIYGSLIIATFARYGDAMDRAWKKRINGWIEAQFTETFVDEPEPMYEPLKPTYSLPVDSPWPSPSSSMRGREKRKESVEELEEELYVYKQPSVNPDGWIPPGMSDGYISLPPPHEITGAWMSDVSPHASKQDGLPEKPPHKWQSSSNSPSAGISFRGLPDHRTHAQATTALNTDFSAEDVQHKKPMLRSRSRSPLQSRLPPNVPLRENRLRSRSSSRSTRPARHRSLSRSRSRSPRQARRHSRSRSHTPISFHLPSRPNSKPSSHQPPHGAELAVSGKIQENEPEHPIGMYKLDEDVTNRVSGWLQQIPPTTMDEKIIDPASTQPEHEHPNRELHPHQHVPNLFNALPLTQGEAVDRDTDLPARSKSNEDSPWRARKSDEDATCLAENGGKSVDDSSRSQGVGDSSSRYTK